MFTLNVQASCSKEMFGQSHGKRQVLSHVTASLAEVWGHCGLIIKADEAAAMTAMSMPPRSSMFNRCSSVFNRLAPDLMATFNWVDVLILPIRTGWLWLRLQDSGVRSTASPFSMGEFPFRRTKRTAHSTHRAR